MLTLITLAEVFKSGGLALCCFGDLLIFSKINFLEKKNQESSLDSDQAWQFVCKIYQQTSLVGKVLRFVW